jgi:hypothetical protein
MNMIAHEDPGEYSGSRFPDQFGYAGDKCSSILIVVENLPAFDSTDHYVVKGSWRIQSGLTGHGGLLPQQAKPVK